MATDWEIELTAALDALAGNVVTDAWVNEMALYGPEDAGYFSDPNLSLVQANLLELRTLDGQFFHFHCVQTYDVFAIYLRLVSVDKQLSHDPGEGLFRTRPMPEFPRGVVSRLQTKRDKGMDVQEVWMNIASRDVFLRAGEVYENRDGTLTISDRDESVLVFIDKEAYFGLTFNEPIYRPFYV